MNPTDRFLSCKRFQSPHVRDLETRAIGYSRKAAALSVVCGLLTSLVVGCSEQPNEPDASANHLIAAREAIDAGDKATARQELDAAIEERPNSWAYFERARLAAKEGQDDQASSDVAAAMELSPDDNDLKWLKAELAKPLAKRFQGRYANPPSSRK